MLAKLAALLVVRTSPGRHLAGVSDINLLSRALEVETLRKIDRPQPANLERFRRIVVLAPHQDDELIGAGGLCELARQAGSQLAVVYLTDGAERGMTGPDGAVLTPPQAALIRQAEAREVCERLGAEYRCIGIDNHAMTVERKHVEALAAALTDFAPDLVVMPWLFDSAPKHRMASHLLWLARGAGKRPPGEIWGYQTNNGLFANRVLDISAVMQRKIELLRLYESQNSFLRRYDHQAMGLGAWNSRYLASRGPALSESYAELFLALPAAEFDGLVERFYFGDFASVYGGTGKLTRAMAALHRDMAGNGT